MGLFAGTLFKWLQRQRLDAGEQRQQQQSRAVYYYYYSFSSEDQRHTTSVSFLSSLIFQILCQDPDRFSHVRDLMVAIDRGSSWTSSRALWILFRSLMMTFRSETTVYCVIDGMQNCEDDFVTLLLQHLSAAFNDDDDKKQSMRAGFKVCLVGQRRGRRDLQRFMDAIPEVRLDGLAFFTELLRSQREQKIAELIVERPYLQEFKEKIDTAISRCENRIQLSLNIHVLKDEDHELLSNRTSINSVVQKLPYTVSDLVSKNFQALPDWARKALAWILRAQRPMKVEELSVAIALVVDESVSVKSNDADRLLDLPRRLTSVFGPLIKVEDNQVCFSDEQVKQCFQQHIVADEQLKSKETPGADHEITHLRKPNRQELQLVTDWDVTCILLKYLRSEEVLLAINKALRDRIWEMPQNPIYDLVEYAIRFWPAHYHIAKQEGSHTKELINLLQDRDLVRVLSELDVKFGSTFGPPDICVSDPLYLGAVLRFADVVDFYVTKSKRETSRSTTDGVYYSNTLYLAS